MVASLSLAMTLAQTSDRGRDCEALSRAEGVRTWLCRWTLLNPRKRCIAGPLLSLVENAKGGINRILHRIEDLLVGPRVKVGGMCVYDQLPISHYR